MNHQKIYDNIIHNARTTQRCKFQKLHPNYIYYEKHHIVPKCLGGSNDSDNLVLLTSREHFICHKLLTYIHKGNLKIGFAFSRMAFCKKYEISSRDFSYAKEITNLSGEKNPMYKKSIFDVWIDKYGKEVAAIMIVEYKEKRKGYKRTDMVWNKGKKCPELANMKDKHHSSETKDRIRLGNTGKTISNETKEKQKKASLGKRKGNVWICKNNETKFIPHTNLEIFLKNDWKKGRK